MKFQILVLTVGTQKRQKTKKAVLLSTTAFFAFH